LNFPQTHPTCLYGDNQAALAMINASRPIERSHHIDSISRSNGKKPDILS
jgi:hypothetical protein